MLGPSDSHPSPPSVFALSCTSHLLLSTSTSPPTIYLRNLERNVPPILLHPRCSLSTVTAANFHPEAANIFVLAFADGSAAVYDASLIHQDPTYGQQAQRSAKPSSDGEIGFIKRLHAISSKSQKHLVEDADWCLDAYETTVQAKALTITAVSLVPGLRATAITVGGDGKCCVVDFTRSTRNKAVLLKTWHLRHPATSLSVVYSKNPEHLSKLDEAAEVKAPANNDYCIAVGRQDGKVLLFDLDGEALGKQILDTKGAPIIDVEWVKNQNTAAFTQVGSSMPHPWKDVPKRKSVGTEIGEKDSREDRLQTGQCENSKQFEDPFFSFSMDSPVISSSSVTRKAINHLDLLHAAGPKVHGQAKIVEANSVPISYAGSLLTSLNSSSSTSPIVDFSVSPPPVPPRPIPKLGGKLSQRRFTTARQTESPAYGIRPAMPANNRRNTANDATPTKPPLPTASPGADRLFGPRSPQDPSTKTRKQASRDYGSYGSEGDLRATHDLPRGLGPEGRPDQNTPATLGDVVSRVASPLILGCATPRLPSPSKLPEHLTAKASSASLRSYQTASSQPGLSDSSTDTVIDWSTVVSSHRLEPSIRGSSHGPVITQLSFLRGRPHRAQLNEEKSRTKDKGRGSINVSTQTSPFPKSSASQLSYESAVADAIVCRPTMKKSPRIADISGGVLSATAALLDQGGYTNSTSTETALQDSTLPSGIERHSSSSSQDNYHISPLLPLKASSSTVKPRGERISRYCPCESHLQAVIATSLDAFRTEMEHGFAAQRQWLEGLVKGEKPAD